MQRLVRRPLTWMICAEALVVIALIGVTWHMLAAAPHTAADGFVLPQLASTPAAEQPIANPVGGVHSPAPAAAGPRPALSFDPAFWRARIGDLNRDGSALEVFEWAVTHAALDAARSYLETVVLPAVQKAAEATP